MDCDKVIFFIWSSILSLSTLLLLGCASIKDSRPDQKVDFESIICSIIDQYFEAFIRDPVDECIRINPLIGKGGSHLLDKIDRSCYKIEGGHFSGDRSIDGLAIGCIPHVEVSYDPNYERIGCPCVISITEPFCFEQDLVYVEYSIDCHGVGSGYNAIYKVRNYAKYDVVHSGNIWIE